MVSPDDIIRAWQADANSVTKIGVLAAANALPQDDAYHVFALYVMTLGLGNIPEAYLRATSLTKHPSWIAFVAKWRADGDPDVPNVSDFWLAQAAIGL